MLQKPTIAVYIPRRLYHIDLGISMFIARFCESIKNDKKYNLLKMYPHMCFFSSVDQAQAFVKKHTIVFVVYYESRTPHSRFGYERGLTYLEQCVPFLTHAHAYIADDKFATKRILEKQNIPVLPDCSITRKTELLNSLRVGELYVAKLHNSQSGRGVKSIKRNDTIFFEYHDRVWQKLKVYDTRWGILMVSNLTAGLYILVVLFIVLLVLHFLKIGEPISSVVLGVLGIVLVVYGEKKLERCLIYNPLMLEPFFGDSLDEFYCLRCTVLGDHVIEAVKKSNTKNVTPNMSHGGVACAVVLSKEQEAIAVAATRAVGAVFAGVDLLFAHGKTIVCEVNVGPIGVYCEQTGVDVGGILADYVLQECDTIIETASPKHGVKN